MTGKSAEQIWQDITDMSYKLIAARTKEERELIEAKIIAYPSNILVQDGWRNLWVKSRPIRFELHMSEIPCCRIRGCLEYKPNKIKPSVEFADVFYGANASELRLWYPSSEQINPDLYKRNESILLNFVSCFNFI